MSGFIKLVRGPDADDLLLDPPAFALLCQVSLRARRTDGYNVHRLEVGEALIGDHKKIGLTRRQYRTRLDRLVTAGFLTIKTTNKGTIAKLTDSRVFDINADESGQQNGQQAASKRPSNGQQAATNKNDKKGKNEKNEKKERVFSSLKEAVSFFLAEFPDRPVKPSLSDLVRKKGKECVTEAYCRQWLTDEHRRNTATTAGAEHEVRNESSLDNGDYIVPGSAEAIAQWSTLKRDMLRKRKPTEAERDFENTGLEYTEPIKIL